jgi:hypothetical protein
MRFDSHPTDVLCVSALAQWMHPARHIGTQSAILSQTSALSGLRLVYWRIDLTIVVDIAEGSALPE